MLDQSLETRNRKYCWTKSMPEISITVCGVEDGDECSEISSCLEDMGISEKEISWS